MKLYKFIPIDIIFTKIKRDYNLPHINEQDIIEWTGEALEHIKCVSSYEEAIQFANVRNHQCELPARLVQLYQIARNRCIKELDEFEFCPNEIVKKLQEQYVEPEPKKFRDFPISPDNNMIDHLEPERDLVNWNDDPNKIPLTLSIDGYDNNMKYGTANYGNNYFMNYDIIYNTERFVHSELYKNCFSPICLSSNSFFNTNATQNIQDEYRIIENVVRFSFKEGQVAFSYVRQQLDENGYPLIPDQVSIIEAICRYIILKITEREMYSNREGSIQKRNIAYQDWHNYCGQAQAWQKFPTLDELENILRQRNRLITNDNAYDGFFRNLNTKVYRNWDNISGRTLRSYK